MLITFALLAFSIMMYFHARLLIPSSAVNVETVEVTFTTTQQVPPASDVSAVPDMDLGDGWQPMCSEQPAGVLRHTAVWIEAGTIKINLPSSLEQNVRDRGTLGPDEKGFPRFLANSSVQKTEREPE
jgi:hypothetical protein